MEAAGKKNSMILIRYGIWMKKLRKVIYSTGEKEDQKETWISFEAAVLEREIQLSELWAKALQEEEGRPGGGGVGVGGLVSQLNLKRKRAAGTREKLRERNEVFYWSSESSRKSFFFFSLFLPPNLFYSAAFLDVCLSWILKLQNQVFMLKILASGIWPGVSEKVSLSFKYSFVLFPDHE